MCFIVMRAYNDGGGTFSLLISPLLHTKTRTLLVIFIGHLSNKRVFYRVELKLLFIAASELLHCSVAVVGSSSSWLRRLELRLSALELADDHIGCELVGHIWFVQHVELRGGVLSGVQHDGLETNRIIEIQMPCFGSFLRGPLVNCIGREVLDKYV